MVVSRGRKKATGKPRESSVSLSTDRARSTGIEGVEGEMVE
jgi:hypothetical protein